MVCWKLSKTVLNAALLKLCYRHNGYTTLTNNVFSTSKGPDRYKVDPSILRSKFKELPTVAEKTIPEYFIAKAKHHAQNGRKYWLIDGLTDEKRHYNKFDEESKKIAAAFYKLGLRKGDVVIFMVRDLSKLHIMLTGVWRANGIMQASYPEDDLNTILSRVEESRVKYIVCEEEAIKLCKQVHEKVKWVVCTITVNRNSAGLPSIEEFLEGSDGAADCPQLLITENDAALILCTSGITGFPKGAVHTHKGFLFQCRSMENIPWTVDKPNLIGGKATHISGTMMVMTLLSTGNTVLVVSELTKESIFRVSHKYKPGAIYAFPPYLMAMAGPEAAAYDFSSLEVILSGGMSVTQSFRDTLMSLPNVKDIVVVYGLTETITCTTSAILKTDEERETPSMRDLPDYSVGKAYPGVELQIRDLESLEILGVGQKGEICVKSPGLFKEYLLNPEDTAIAHHDGYFRTGDIGYFDSDGFVYVVDRSKEIFKYYNDHISPTELESVIGSHPKVGEVCVIGVEDAGGHVPRAFVTVHSNSENRKALANEIKEFANANLASYKSLRGGLYIVDKLPKGKSGEITRQLVEKLPLPSQE